MSLFSSNPLAFSTLTPYLSFYESMKMEVFESEAAFEKEYILVTRRDQNLLL